ncbi:MAG TPA: NAD-dependent deacylase [Spirochaetota bacterium]|nr:NAD-dependent deacylase [Spirochaetota bacterium]HOD16986.1 NAD-dependent deacylase [Spirochaetota bacterium]HPG50551.1 NAD-dependent deacylase [Spirochaetota bacterium]HPN11413.1 NAD-dependent deacylase [Spirochaetota bacterium]HQL83791.1 NAD-dependent deacylase [Spirochaetota bacterium]
MDINIARAVEIIQSANNIIALTGAGISTESGIPDFRSAGGLWQKYNPSEYATIQAFYASPEKVWRMLFDMVDLTRTAKPNPGHLALAELERMERLQCIITQNIDNLHQEAGSRNVIEYHGNVSRLECLGCGRLFDDAAFNMADVIASKKPPRCTGCRAILKPTVVFFGEMIPHEAMVRSQEAAQEADAVMVVGTSAVVYPAAGIPLIAKQNNAVLIEFNVETTDLTRFATDVFIQGLAGTTLPELVRQLKSS